MPRRPPEKTKHVRPRHVHKRERKYDPLPFQETPVNIGQEIDVVIDDIGSRGDGITRIGSFLVFVPGTKVGERLKIKIVSIGRKFAVAEKI
jgi:predicted RNA-binding protein with TRAM domain